MATRCAFRATDLHASRGSLLALLCSACSLSGLADGGPGAGGLGAGASSGAETTLTGGAAPSGLVSSSSSASTFSTATGPSTTGGGGTGAGGTGAGGTGAGGSGGSGGEGGVHTGGAGGAGGTGGVGGGWFGPVELAFQARSNSTDKYRIHVRSLAGTDAGTPITDPAKDCGDPALAPDGDRIAYVCEADAGFDIFVQEFDGSPPQAVPRPFVDPSGRMTGPSFDASGSYLVFAWTSNQNASSNGVYQINVVPGQVASAKPALLSAGLSYQQYYEPAYLPYGDVIVRAKRPSTGSMVLVLLSDEFIEIDCALGDLREPATSPLPGGDVIAVRYYAGDYLLRGIPEVEKGGTKICNDNITTSSAELRQPAFASSNTLVVTAMNPTFGTFGQLRLLPISGPLGPALTPANLEAQNATVAWAHP